MPARPKNPKKITAKDLLPGDIILSAGAADNELDQMIFLLDQGIYSHATQYIGFDGKEHQVVEATREGVKLNNLDPDMTQVLVDVYRYISDEKNKFGDPGWPVEPVLEKAKSYVGAKYSYSELLMAAITLVTTEMISNAKYKELMALGLDRLAHELEKWLNTTVPGRLGSKNQIPMTCVQVVTSAHWFAESQPENKYALKIPVELGRKNPFDRPQDKNHEEAFLKIQNDLHNILLEKHPGYRKQAKADDYTYFTAGSDLLPLGTCTPRDLQFSKNLTFVGCIKDSRSVS